MSTDIMWESPAFGGGLTADAVRPLASVAGRALGLFVVRESDEWDLELFSAMREQTYAEHRHIPDVAAVLQLGMEPMGARSFWLRGPDGEPSRLALPPPPGF